MQEQPLNPVMVDRAVQLWLRALAAPVYNNLSPGEVHIPSMMANALLQGAQKDNTPEKLAAFGEALKKRLNTPRPSRDGSFSYYENYIAVDYHPCEILGGAAEDAGQKMPLPIKTSMHINEDSVSFRMGYSAGDLTHYPLADGRWLITDLRGRDDIKKIISAINAGVDIGLTIEPA